MTPRRRRILVSTDAVGGVWTYALELAGALRRELEVELAVLGPPLGEAQRREAARADAVVHATGLPLDWTAGSPAELAEATEALAELARRRQAKLVQLHSLALVGGAAWPAPILAVQHSCVGTWWRALRGAAPPPADFAWRMAAVRTGLLAADVVVAPTCAIAEATRQVYGARRRIEIVYNACGNDLNAGDKAGGFGVLAAGRLWDEAKNISMLDQAAGLMQVPVAAAGATAGPNGAGIALRCIRALGALTPEDLRGAFAGARIFAAPARYEPFGLAVLEAAQAGLPLVLADIPGFREVWGDAALFLPPDDPEIWARVLGRLHGDPGECGARGELARARARNYSPRRFAGAMREIYDPLLALADAA